MTKRDGEELPSTVRMQSRKSFATMMWSKVRALYTRMATSPTEKRKRIDPTRQQAGLGAHHDDVWRIAQQITFDEKEERTICKIPHARHQTRQAFVSGKSRDKKVRTFHPEASWKGLRSITSKTTLEAATTSA